MDHKELEQDILQTILPTFTTDLPVQLRDQNNLVSMDLCLSTLQVTTLTGTNIQQAVEVISQYQLLESPILA